jgi:peptidoglycan/LPS O-acetylase OafA/YrhL
LGGDYSYGIYLYAFPIQQAVAFGLSRVWYVHLPLALAGTLLVAAFSWHVVEKPTLRLKRLLKSTGPARARSLLPESTATAPAAPQ